MKFSELISKITINRDNMFYDGYTDISYSDEEANIMLIDDVVTTWNYNNK